MGFIEDLSKSAKTKKEIKKEKQIEIDIQKLKNKEKSNAIKEQFIKDFIDVTQQDYIIELIKDVCINASKKAIYNEKKGKRQICGYISLYREGHKDSDGDWHSYDNNILNCITYKENFHLFKENTVDTYFKLIYFGSSPKHTRGIEEDRCIESSGQLFKCSDCVYKIVKTNLPHLDYSLSLEDRQDIEDVSKNTFVDFLKKELPEFSFKLLDTLHYDYAYSNTKGKLTVADNGDKAKFVIEFSVNF